ncbi:hypothetical protein GCM10022223_38960 [Kineosporia mesophila]|uniref:DUF2637 domain-containing protein n=1 Tax=Kineosporia mesophila TaxID=566012 RepID=A0ABP6ZYA6_9ACTN|nr:hypothetical protein [Kineosporia mesophila]MCD5348521.1 hypothetical protein [Kineosporia mesophila]
MSAKEIELSSGSAEEAVQSVRRRGRAWPVLLLALPAFVAIWSGWVELGGMTGFGEVKPLPGIADAFVINTAITLPIGVETYAAYALNVWLSGGNSERATRFARTSALGSLALGAGGQIAYHLMKAAGIVHAPWWITAVVACLPVAVLGMGAALHHLVNEIEAPDRVSDQVPTLDTAEARTERAVIVNAMRERHTDWPAETVTEVAEALASAGDLPTPARRTLSAEADSDLNAAEAPEDPSRTERKTSRSKATSGRSTRGTGAKVAELRAKHPDWTVDRIAAKAGVTDRTVRRHLNATNSIAPTATGAPTLAPAEVDQTPDIAA